MSICDVRKHNDRRSTTTMRSRARNATLGYFHKRGRERENTCKSLRARVLHCVTRCCCMHIQPHSLSLSLSRAESVAFSFDSRFASLGIMNTFAYFSLSRDAPAPTQYPLHIYMQGERMKKKMRERNVGMATSF